MKRILTIILALVMVLSLVACTPDTNEKAPEGNTTEPTSNYDEDQVPDDVPGSNNNATESTETTEPTEPIDTIQKTLADVDQQFNTIVATGDVIAEGSPVYDYFFLACMEDFWFDSTYAVIPNEVSQLDQILSLLESKTWGETKTIKVGDIKALNATLTSSEFGALITFTSEDQTKTIEEAVNAGEWAVVIVGMEDVKTTLGVDNSESIAEAILNNFGQPTMLEYDNSDVDGHVMYSVTYTYQLTNAIIQLQLTKMTDSLLTGDYVCAIAIAPIN